MVTVKLAAPFTELRHASVHSQSTNKSDRVMQYAISVSLNTTKIYCTVVLYNV
jgi:hypothetical protein